MSAISGILIFIAIIIVTGILFAGWVFVMIVRGLTRLIFGPPKPAMPMHPAPGMVLCRYELCHANNVPEARFCRRCGREIALAQDHPLARRANVA